MILKKPQQVVSEWVAHIERGNHSYLMANVWRDVSEVGWSVVSALADSLEQLSWETQITMAGMMLAMNENHSTGVLSDAQIDGGQRILRESLRDPMKATLAR